MIALYNEIHRRHGEYVSSISPRVLSDEETTRKWMEIANELRAELVAEGLDSTVESLDKIISFSERILS